MEKTYRLRWSQYLTGQVVDWFLVFWCLFAFSATPVLLLRISPLVGRFPEWLVLAGGVILGVGVLKTCRPVLPKTATLLTRLPAPILAIGVGFLLRCLWVMIFPSAPSSDGAIYLQLANGLASGKDYAVAGTVAYWPAGYPLWLAGWLFIFDVPTAIFLSQATAYLIAIVGIFQLTRHLRGSIAANVAIWVFALWPNLLAQFASPEKESVVIALLPWVILTILKKAKSWYLFIAGMAVGASILVQPGLQFLLPLMLIVIWLKWPGNTFVKPALMLIIGAALVVLPWTFRNMSVLGSPVLVSTNGGSNLYRANNPLADGGYTHVGEHDLSHLSELESDRMGKKLAIDWIRSNPIAFLKLGLEKQILFMGDDSATIHASLKRGGGTSSTAVYVVIKAIANFWWVLIWFFLALAVIVDRVRVASEERWLIWCWFYLFALHSIFESNGKYHIPMIWIICVMVGCLVVRVSESVER